MKPRRARINPSKLEKTREMAEAFHGRGVDREIDFQELVKVPTSYAVIGELEELEIVPLTGKKVVYPVSFVGTWEKDQDVVQVCTDSEGKQVYFESGDQILPKELIEEIEGTNNLNQRFLLLGYCMAVTYCTDKHHLEEDENEKVYKVWVVEPNGSRELAKERLTLPQAEELVEEISLSVPKSFQVFWNVSYRHEFGESGGEWPVIIYDELNHKLILAGGTYEVRDVGIYN